MVLFSAVRIRPYRNSAWDKRASSSDNPCSDATWDSHYLPPRFTIFLRRLYNNFKVEVWLELWIWIWIRETFLGEITRLVTIQTFCGFTDIVLTYFKSTFFFGFSIGTRFMVSSRHGGSDCMELYKLKSKGCEVWSYNIVHTVPINKINPNFGPEIPENMLWNNLKWICGWPRGYSLNLEHWIIGKLGQNSYSILIIYSKIP